VLRGGARLWRRSTGPRKPCRVGPSIGAFTGERLDAARFAQRKAAGGRCLLRYTDLDDKEVLLDGEGRRDCAFVNSVAGIDKKRAADVISKQTCSRWRMRWACRWFTHASCSARTLHASWGTYFYSAALACI
jgi:hypothetical protein